MTAIDTKTPPKLGQVSMVAALHLPDLSVARHTSMAFLEDFVLANMAVFAEAGVPAVMLQDQTRATGPASTSTIAVMASLGRLIRQAFPTVELGILIQAHDGEAPLAIAHATGATFVRLKVFVGAVMSMEGPKSGLAVTSTSYRHALRRDDLTIMADVFDRTSVPTIAITPEEAARGAEKLGADILIITGATLTDSLERIRRARAAGVRRPILLGGSVSEETLPAVLAVADGAIVSTALMRQRPPAGDLVQWDADKTRRFMDRVRALQSQGRA